MAAGTTGARAARVRKFELRSLGLDFLDVCSLVRQEEIRNENATIKIGAVNQLHLIASALGPQRTVSELIPYVVQVVQEEPLCNDDEFLYSMARQYAVLSDYINGNDEMLIAPLEHLAAQEETVIRDQAIQSLCKVIEKRPALAPDYLVPTLHRLATKTDFFTARVSACALLPLAYRKKCWSALSTWQNQRFKLGDALGVAFLQLRCRDGSKVNRSDWLGAKGAESGKSSAACDRRTS
eukprot:s3076_g2.t1